MATLPTYVVCGCKAVQSERVQVEGRALRTYVVRQYTRMQAVPVLLARMRKSTEVRT